MVRRVALGAAAVRAQPTTTTRLRPTAAFATHLLWRARARDHEPYVPRGAPRCNVLRCIVPRCGEAQRTAPSLPHDVQQGLRGGCNTVR
jgi:hypothetical protein